MTDKDRNKFILPEAPEGAEGRRRGCPACGHEDFTGRRVGGVITFTCTNKDCGNSWQGGLPQEPYDSRQPLPPEDPRAKPPVSFEKDQRGKFQEIRRPVNTTPDFRKGAPVPPGDEDV